MNKHGLNILVIFTFIIAGSIMGYDEPEYKVLKEYDKFEIRKYESYVIAEIEVEQNFENAGDSAFQPLFKYISGNNISKDEMEMTIPVNLSRSNSKVEKLEMTTPVSQSATNNEQRSYKVSFVLPLNYTIDDAPIPIDPRVKIRKVPEKIMAVLEYSGTWSKENYNENEKQLFSELKKENIRPVGQPVFARYNPPFWPWFLRRNEVQIEINLPSEFN